MANETQNTGISGMTLSDSKLNSYYQSALKTLPVEKIDRVTISTPDRSIESITEDVKAYLDPQYNEAVRQRQAQTKQYAANIDADAYSRGMGSSTWVTDNKNRQYAAEASDIASIGNAYSSNLAQSVSEQYENYLNRKLNVDNINAANQIEVDKWNAQVAAAMEELAYSRALDEYSRSKSGGGRRGIVETNPFEDLDIVETYTENDLNSIRPNNPTHLYGTDIGDSFYYNWQAGTIDPTSTISAPASRTAPASASNLKTGR